MYELTAMQAACWVNGHAKGEEGTEPSAHLYVELETTKNHAEIDGPRLSKAVAALVKRHPQLRLAVDPQGQPRVVSPTPAHNLHRNVLRGLDPLGCEAALARIRDAKTHQRLALSEGEACEFTLTQLSDGRRRLHIDIDMVGADPSCFPYLMDELAILYEDGPDALPEQGGDFAKYLDQQRRAPDLSARTNAAQQWWAQQIPKLPPAPALPKPKISPRDRGTNTARLATTLSAQESDQFYKVARALRVTPSALALTVFGTELARACDQDALRLTVPTFHRPDAALIGDFSDFSLIGVGSKGSLSDAATRVQSDLINAVTHGARPGPQLMRDLARHLGQVPDAPVIFTAGFDHPLGTILPERAARNFGDLIYSVSQGPGVALDAQIAKLDDRILINWDIRLDLVDQDWITALFDRFVARLQSLADENQTALCSQPLSQLQRAYLMGREEALPLGGVAMQEVRLFRGKANHAQIKTRLSELTTAYPALRTQIDAPRLSLSFAADVQPVLRTIDLSTAQDAQADLDHWWNEFAHIARPLDAPLWEVCIIQMPDGQDDAVAVKFDALALDGPAIAQVCAQLFNSDPITQQEPPKPRHAAPAPARLVDQRYWEKALQSVESAPRLPWKTPLHHIKSSRYCRVTQHISADQKRALRRAGAQDKLFINSLLSFVALEVLARFTTDMRICVGLPTAPALDDAGLGNRSSFIVVDHDATDGTATERAARLQTQVMEGLSHMGYADVDLARHLLAKTQEPLALPVVLTNGLNWASQNPDTPMREVATQTQTPQVALDIRLMNAPDGGIEIAADYAQAALNRDTVTAMLDAMVSVIDHICNQTALSLPFPIVPAKLPAQTPDIPDPAPHLVQIAEHLRTGTGTALIQGDRSISYAELRKTVEALLGGFVEHGLTAGDVLAIHLPRSIEHIALQIAASCAGLIWVPLDAAAPQERRDYQLQRCAPKLVISMDDIADWPTVTPNDLPAARVPLPSDTELRQRSLTQDPSYYLFTSGTTGAPKCVVLNNRATANVLDQTLRQWDVDANDVLMSATPLHHDMSLFDIFGALSAGATLVMPEIGQDKDAMEWAQIVARHKVTIWVSVPAILEMLLDCARPEQLQTLRIFAQGGDYIKPTQIARLRSLRPDARLVSLGGPTETTIWSIWHEITDETGAIPYGRPLDGAEYVICNSNGEPCPPGVVGRIHTLGDCLSLGYLANSEIISTDFVTLQDGKGGLRRAFRTGDLGQWTDDGTILFAGRVGGYVKVRGVRVSLGEIETVLGEHSDLRQAMIVDLQSDDGRETTIAAICVAQDGANITTAALRSYMRDRLPQSHLPDRFLLVPTLPLSANGKFDRGAARRMLRDSPKASPKPQNNDVDPSLVTGVLDIYLKHIGTTGPADADSPLMQLGLRPKHLVLIAGDLNQNFGCKLSPAQLIGARTARQAAALITKQPALSAT
ncbi:amino acid adenylation domain-containing protein [Loktanella sp. S4079]|uniref:amino acid adenylation domain-containing protein n=1 Tax=Loktanella sp. S4079 TaxID=579483 RepID=UPI0005F9DF86|nr:amino acid adenylation domain-containing protein [Loktanella sp. S4079]KJZ18617.1 hypothetical protein TW80_14530 [Loktanella sp. S4079]